MICGRGAKNTKQVIFVGSPYCSCRMLFLNKTPTVVSAFLSHGVSSGHTQCVTVCGSVRRLTSFISPVPAAGLGTAMHANSDMPQNQDR